MYWFFSRNDKRLHFGDLRPIEVGITHTVPNTIQIGKWGLHASRDIMIACAYGHGTTVWKVKLGGTVLHQTEVGYDISCATMRTYLAGGVNVENVLNEFVHKISNIPGESAYSAWNNSSSKDADRQLLIDMIEKEIAK